MDGLLLLLEFLQDLADGAYTLDCGEQDIARIVTLVRRYADLGLGCADAAVIATAERPEYSRPMPWKDPTSCARRSMTRLAVGSASHLLFRC